MLASIKLIQDRLLEEVKTDNYRYLYQQLNTDNRLLGLVGPRGVGKTTLLIQYLKNHPDIAAKGIYFSADHIYFSQTTLYESIEELYLSEGTHFFFIDEIHKYANWSQELKNIYDGFPAIKIIFSGSSSLDLIKGSYDLTRRAVLLRLPGMSFREYLNFVTDQQIEKVKFDELLSGQHQLSEVIARTDRIKGHFQDYLRGGYYPFSISEPQHFEERLLRVIEKTVFEDIANYYKIKTENLPLFKKILAFLASIKPGSVTAHNLAKNMKINDRTVMSYLTALHETGLIQMVYPYEGGNVSLRKPEKVFLNNTNLLYALENSFGKEVEIGTVRELMFIQSLQGSTQQVYFSHAGDYRVREYTFEIGDPKKSRKQIQSVKNAFLVKDELASTGKNTIPLIYFGFLY